MAADPLGGEAAAGPAPRQHPQQGQYFEVAILKRWQVSFGTCEGRI